MKEGSGPAKCVAFIPVRGGSRSIPMKNIKPMCGRPLVYWTAAAANGCNYIDEVYIATDSDAIREAVEGLDLEKVRVIGRSAESATDTASTEFAMLEFAEAHEFEDIVLVQATSPLLSSADLDRGFELYRQDGIDSVLSAVEDKRFYWTVAGDGAHPVNYDVFARPRRQDFPGYLMENGAFYITSRARLLESRNRVSGRIAISVMSEESAQEIDELADWPVIEHLLARRLRSEGIMTAEPEAAEEASTLDAADSGVADAPAVKLLLTDCDGCMTDGGMYYSESGEESKKFNTRDGMAFALLRERGVKVGIVTGENSQAAARRGKKLKADYVELACKDKLAAVKRICEAEGITLAEVAYIGDDVNDVEVLSAVGRSFAPADAQPEAKRAAGTVLSAAGGTGVVREAARAILGELRTER